MPRIHRVHGIWFAGCGTAVSMLLRQLVGKDGESFCPTVSRSSRINRAPSDDSLTPSNSAASILLRSLIARRRRLWFRCRVPALPCPFRGPSRFLVAAERERHVAEIVRVDPHRAGTDAPCELVCDTEVTRPHARGEAVVRAISFLCDPVQIVIVERYRTHDRAKDFVAHHRHVGPCCRSARSVPRSSRRCRRARRR